MERILSYSSAFQKNKSAGQNSLFGSSEQIETANIELESTRPADKKQRLAWERELLGMYVSEHPLAGIGHILEPHRTKKLSEIKPELESQYVRVSGIVTNLQKIMTRSNQKMIFAKIEDTETNLEILVFPKLLETMEDVWKTDKILAVEGFVSFKDGAPKILAEAAYEILENTKVPEFIPKTNKRDNWRKKGQGDGGGYNSSNNAATGPSGPKVEYKLAPEKLLIEIPKDSDRSILMEIKEILLSHPGEVKVTLKVPNNGDGHKEIAIKNNTEPSPVVIRKLKELVGKERVLLY